MDVREKLVELILNADADEQLGSYDLYDLTHERTGCAKYFADYLIAHGVTVQEWISVKDRLPEGQGRYIATVCNYQGKIDAFDLWFDYPEWYIDEDDDLYKFEVTHWMPLPQPPKGE